MEAQVSTADSGIQGEGGDVSIQTVQVRVRGEGGGEEGRFYYFKQWVSAYSAIEGEGGRKGRFYYFKQWISADSAREGGREGDGDVSIILNSEAVQTVQLRGRGGG